MKFQNVWAMLMGTLFIVGGLLELRSDLLSFSPAYGWIHIATGVIFIIAIFRNCARRVNDHVGIAYLFVGTFGLFGLVELSLFVNLFHFVIAGLITHGVSHLAHYEHAESC